jgi:hypothetical protein
MLHPTTAYMNDISELDRELETMLPDNSVTTYTKPKETITFDKISEGNGKFYTIDADDITPKQTSSMKYDHLQMIIQIFIELRNALGYSSIKPHKFYITNLVNGINTFQIEYSKKYGILFSYGFKVIKANPLYPESNKRTLNQLIEERKREFAECKLPNIPTPEDVKHNKERIKNIKNDPFLKKRFGVPYNEQTYFTNPLSDMTTLLYNPMPQRGKRCIHPKDTEEFSCATKPKIYGNRQIIR